MLNQVQQDSSPISLLAPKESSQAQYDVVKLMKKIPALISMFDYLSISKPARRMLERAMADIAEKLGGPKTFTDSLPQLDFVTDFDLLESGKVPALSPISALQGVELQLHGLNRMKLSPLLFGVITFSDQDLCHPQPDHNRPLYVSVIHHEKLIWHALVDTGASVNIHS